MSKYTRPKRPSAPLFFTVPLAERGVIRLMDRVDVLRSAVRVMEAEENYEYSVRIDEIKARLE